MKELSRARNPHGILKEIVKLFLKKRVENLLKKILLV